MRTFKINTSFSTSEYKLGSDNVLRNSIGRAAMDDVIRDLRKGGHDISDAVVEATMEARDQELRDFMGVAKDGDLGAAVRKHLKKQIRAQY